MLLKIGTLFVLFEMGFSGCIALPKFHSASANSIDREYRATTESKSEDSGKAFLQSTNVEKPETEEYRLLEVQVEDAAAANVDSLDLQGLVKAVLNEEEHWQREQQRRRRRQQTEARRDPNPHVVPNSILGVRDVGLGPDYRGSVLAAAQLAIERPLLVGPSSAVGQKVKSPGQDKLYYLKGAANRPKVHVNFRGHSGSFGQAKESWLDPKHGFEFQMGAANVEHATRPYKESSPARFANNATIEASEDPPTTENGSFVTSSELPKQIPAPPSKIPTRSLRMTHTTPVQRYAAPRRVDVLVGYSFSRRH